MIEMEHVKEFVADYHKVKQSAKTILEDAGYIVVPCNVSICRVCLYYNRREKYAGSYSEFDVENRYRCKKMGNINCMSADQIRFQVDELPSSMRQCPYYKGIWEEE